MDSHDSDRMCCLESPKMKSMIKGHIQYLDWVKSLESQVPQVSFHGMRERPEGFRHPPIEAAEAAPECRMMKSILKKPLSSSRKKAETSSKDSIEKSIQIHPQHKISIAVFSSDDSSAANGNQRVYLQLSNPLKSLIWT